jgi:predicted metal-dependent phosphoesterase TrpH
VIDLHVHSTASDGSDPPARIIGRAAAAGLEAVALTDHDTVEGLAEARAAAAEHGIRLIPGCELSCEVPTGTMHLLVYFLDDGPGPLQDELARLRDARHTRNERIAAVLRAHGLDVTVADILEESGGGTVGRPHIAGVLLKKGYVTSIQEAFDVWLANGRPAYLGRDRLTPADAIRLTHESGALAVLAHPMTLGLPAEEEEAFIASLVGLGLDGLECEYGRYTPEERARYHALAAAFGLAPTGGSDYHGTYKPDLAIGTGTGDLAVPESLLVGLEARWGAG